MHASFFSYTLTRAYPYRWFTWIVVLGGVAATALFTAINIAANGYDVGLTSVVNPNATEDPGSPQWYLKSPWTLVSKVSPKCQDQIIPVGSEVFTSNLGFPYRILDLKSKRLNPSPFGSSLAYHYSAFEHCHIDQARAYVWPGSTNFNVSVELNCTIYTNSSLTSVKLWHSLKPEDPKFGLYYSDGEGYQASTTWGMKLLIEQISFYRQRQNNMTNSRPWTVQGLWSFHRSDSDPEPKVWSSIMSTNDYNNETAKAFIGKTYFFPPPTMSIVSPLQYPSNFSNLSMSTWINRAGYDALSLFDGFSKNDGAPEKPSNTSFSDNHAIIAIDNLLKVYLSLLLTDLGQPGPSNMLSQARSIWNYLSSLNTWIEASEGFDFINFFYESIHKESPSDTGYKFNVTTSNDISTLFSWIGIAEPSVGPAFINTLYLCSVPTMRPLGSLIVAVAVGDLVFLQALWTFFNIVVKNLLESQDSLANDCPGCLRTLEQKNITEHRQFGMCGRTDDRDVESGMPSLPR